MSIFNMERHLLCQSCPYYKWRSCEPYLANHDLDSRLSIVKHALHYLRVNENFLLPVDGMVYEV
jgi:hypothetical protein